MASGVIIPVVRAGGAAARWVLKYFDDAKNVTKTSTHSSLGDAKKAAAKGGVGNPKVLKQGLRKEKTMSKKVVGRQSGSQVGSVPPPKPKPKKKKSSAIDKYLTSPRRLIGPSEMMGRPPIKESLPRKEPKIIMSGPGKKTSAQRKIDALSDAGYGDATLIELGRGSELDKAYTKWLQGREMDRFMMKGIFQRPKKRKGGGKVLYKKHGGSGSGSLKVIAVDRKTGKKDPVASKRIKRSNELLERVYPSERKTGMALRPFIQKRVNDLIRQFVSDDDARTMRAARKVADDPLMQKKGLIGSRSRSLDEPRNDKKSVRSKSKGKPKGGNVYRRLGGKVTDGNDVIKMIYD